MQHVFITELLPLELVLCTAIVVGGCRFVYKRCREDPRTQRQQIAHTSSISYSSDRFGRSVAMLTKPMLLAKIEAESANVTTRIARASRLRSLTGLHDVGRLTEVIEETLLPLMIKELSPNGLAASGLMANYDQHLLTSLAQNPAVATIKLSEFVGLHTFSAVAGALFGPTFPADTVFQDYALVLRNEEVLDASPWQWTPSKRGVCQARERLTKTFSLYLEEWWYADGLDTIPGISRLVEKLLHGSKDEELDLEEASCALLSLMVEAHLNLWATTSCLMSQILSNASTLQNVVEEARTSSDYFFSRLLESAMEEVLRWAPGRTPVRHLKGDAVFTIDKKPHSMKSGTKLVLDLSGVHFDEDVYEHPNQFDISRFRNDCLPLPRRFGEGRHMVSTQYISHERELKPAQCKGGHLAKLQIMSFVYHVFRMLDLQVKNSDRPAEPIFPSSSHIPTPAIPGVTIADCCVEVRRVS